MPSSSSASCSGSSSCFGYRLDHPDKDKSYDERDSAPYMLKCRVIDPAFTWGASRKPETSWARTIIYEMHVKGFTQRHPLIPESDRGTFAGLSHPAIPAYLRSLGVTSVELLPIHSFIDDSYLVDKGLRNYWGYNSIGFFAPETRYLRTDGANEFKTMINQFHAHGLEVILDVVYNHTAEGNELGPTLSFKGIDNASYYRLLPEQRRYYINDTGTGNTVNLSHPRVLQMVADSLRYWATEMRVDGFRFDLATILAREPYGFDEGGGFLDACRQDPVLSGVKLIAEPWDIGPGGYQVGRFPPGWAEWNDKFRDTVRSYWKGDAGLLPDLAKRISGSGDLFNKRGRRPWASINFVTAHDGFNLNDLVSYNDKHNEANGEDNRDGHSNNHSWNHGVEGPTDDPDILELRERQKRNLLATVLLSHGTPMLLAGDEFGHTQNGNNNAYAQDNDINWPNWLGISAAGPGVAGIHPPPDRHAQGVSDPLPQPLSGRLAQRGARRYRRHLAHAGGHRNDDRTMAGRQRPLLRHAARRPRAGKRHQAARIGRDAADRLQRPSRCRPVHAARGGRRPALGRPDRHRPAGGPSRPPIPSVTSTTSPADRSARSRWRARSQAICGRASVRFST